jgi:hypothetical protein
MTLLGLTGPHLLRTRDALGAAFPDPDAMEELLLSLDRGSFRQFSAEASNFRANVLRVVQQAVREQWLAELLSKAAGLVPDDVALREVLDGLAPAALPLGISHFKVCRLAGDYVLLDRAKLRTSVERISKPLGKRILVVTGDAKTGKSHSVQFISYLNEVLGTFSFIHVDLEAFKRFLGPGKVIEPDDLARLLVRKLRYDNLKLDDSPDDKQWSRWVLDFCEAFETIALEDPVHRWLVIDAFNSIVVTQPTLDLIKELATRISKTLIRFRLVLLGYQDTFPLALRPMVEAEHIKRIGFDDLVDFFDQAFRQLGIECDDDGLYAAVERVLADLDLAREDVLVDLGPRVGEELAQAARLRRNP